MNERIKKNLKKNEKHKQIELKERRENRKKKIGIKTNIRKEENQWGNSE